MFLLIYHTVSIILDGCLLYNRSHRLPWDPAGEGGDGVDPVPFGVGRHSRLYQEIDGGDKGAGEEGLESFNKGFFLFGSWFLSKKAAEAAASIGVDLIGVVKTNTKRFCKAMIEGLTKDWPGRSYIVLGGKHMVPG